MVYEKKIEPLRKFEAIMAGVTLILFVLILEILPWANTTITCDEEILKFSVSSEDDMIKFHDCIKKHKSMYLFGATCLLLGYPIILAHIHYMYRTYETLWSCYSFSLFECLYFGSWIISATIYCIILPALIIFFVYYDWEFADGNEYLGYAMQFEFAHFSLILADCVMIPFGFTASLTWWSSIFTIFGVTNSYHWKIIDSSDKVLGNSINCPNIGKLFGVLISLFMALTAMFGSFATVFDYEKSGFFSYHGNSQWLYIIMFISWITIGIMNIYVGCTLDKIQMYLNNNVKSIPLSKRQNEQVDTQTAVATVQPVESEIDIDAGSHDASHDASQP